MASPVAIPLKAASSDWRKMNKQELRDALASRGLDTDGLRPSLIQRLESSSKLAEIGVDVVAEETPKAQEEASDHEKKESQEITENDSKEETGTEEVFKNPHPTPQNANAGSTKESSPSVEEDDKQEPNGGNGCVASSAGSLTDFEKRQRRAERFGMELQVSEQEKRNIRAARFGGVQGSNKVPGDKSTEAEKRKQRAARFGIVDDESKKKARQDRFGQGSKQDDSVESEKRKARAARFGSPTEESSLEAKRDLNPEPAATVASA